MIGIIGGGLAGLAAAARLARVDHEVIVLEQQPVLDPGLDQLGSPAEPIVLPAAWRDLFVKSGRKLEAELARRELQLVPAGPARFGISDGPNLELPTDRASQWHYLQGRFGDETARGWRDLLDRLDESWLVLRRIGLESEFEGRLLPDQRQQLRVRQSLATLATEVPAMSEVLLQLAARLGQDPRRLPGWHAARFAVERNFGRWIITDSQERASRPGVLTELLRDRLESRGVTVRTGIEVQAIRAFGQDVRVQTSAGELTFAAVISTVDPFTHADLTRERGDLRTAHRLRRSPSGGPRWDSWRTLGDLPRLQPGRFGVLYASGWSPGGPDAWAQLLTGALAAYRCHEQLTGQDMRPTNKEYRRGARR